jgi:excisionase family DNA binding protein
LLFGDGIDTPGRIRGEADRQLVTTELRRMRSAFDEVAQETERQRTDAAGERVAGLEDELQRIASFRSRSQLVWGDDDIPALVTPAEAAQVLRVGVGSVYRAIRNEEIRATRLSEKRGALRIPRSELRRLLEGRPRTNTPSVR